MEAKAKPVTLTLPDHYSYSQLKKYRECPGSWKDDKILRLPQETSDPAIFGSTFHDLTAHYDLHCKSRQVQTDYGAADAIFEVVMRDHPEAAPQRAELGELFAEYIQRTIVDFDHLIGVEMPLDTEIAGVHFTGTLDRLFRFQDPFALTVRDHKSDGRIRTQAEVDTDWQLSIYAMLAARTVNWTGDVAVEMLFDRYGVLRRSVRTPEQIEGTVEDIAALIETIQGSLKVVPAITLDEAFPYTPGSRCSICGTRSSCPRLKKLADEDGVSVIVTTEDEQAAFVQYVALAARLNQVTKVLKRYCSTHGNIIMNGLDLGFHVSESYKYPTVQTVDILKAHKIDPLTLLKVDTTGVKKLVRAGGETAEALIRIRTDASKTTFKAVKVKG